MTASATGRAVISQRAAVTTVAAVFACGLILDAATKVLAVHRLDPDNPPSILGGLLTLQLIRNPGAAFSIGEDYTWIFAILATAALTAIVLLLVPRVRHRGWAVAIGLIIAGIGGNLIDRLVRPPAPFRGHVIDFLQLPAIGGYQWPIFNIADICVSSGAVLVALLAIVFRVDWDGLTEQQRRAAADEQDGPDVDRDDRPDEGPDDTAVADAEPDTQSNSEPDPDRAGREDSSGTATR